MRTKEWLWIGVLVVLGSIYIHFFSHWGDKSTIGISATLRPNRRGGGPPTLVVFTLNESYKLTSLKVVPMEGTNFNPLATPVWHLISDSNSIPIRAIRYGQPIKGMKPALKHVHPDELAPGTAYRLMLTATGEATGYKDFKTIAP